MSLDDPQAATVVYILAAWWSFDVEQPAAAY